MQGTENQEEINDSCPTWAAEMIMQLRQVEIYLGNIPEGLAWKSTHIKEVSQRVFAKEEQVFDDHKAEWIYKRIVRSLAEASFSSEDIRSFINSRIGYAGGPAYTSKEEIEAVFAEGV